MRRPLPNILRSLSSSQRGFGILEALIALTITSVACVGAAGMLKYMQQGQKSVTQYGDFQLLVERARLLLSRKENCASLLPSEAFPETLDSTFHDVIVAPQRSLTLADGTKLIAPVIDQMTPEQARDAQLNSFSVSSLRYQKIQPLAGAQYLATLEVAGERYPRPSTAGIGMTSPPLRARHFDIVIELDAVTRVPSSCVSMLSYSPSSGSSSTPTSSSTGNPPPNENACQVGQVQVGTDAENKVVCQPEIPCSDGQQLVIGVAKDVGGNPLLGEDGVPRKEWVCASSSPDAPDFVELCDGICF